MRDKCGDSVLGAFGHYKSEDTRVERRTEGSVVIKGVLGSPPDLQKAEEEPLGGSRIMER